MVTHRRPRKPRFFTGGMLCTEPTINSITPVVELLGRVLLRRVDRLGPVLGRMLLILVYRVVLPLVRVLLSWEGRLLLCRVPLLQAGG